MLAQNVSHDHGIGHKSVYKRWKSGRSARGTVLAATTFILIVAAATWITNYTRTIETQTPTQPAPAALAPGQN